MSRPRTQAAVMLLLFLASSLAFGSSRAEPAALVPSAGALSDAFDRAAREFNVPRDLLVTIAYAETRFDNHNGEPSIDNGFGLMHLVDNPSVHTLPMAAQLLQISPDVLKTDPAQNIRGAAAILNQYAREQGLTDAQRSDTTTWYSVVARYSNATSDLVARTYADEVYRLINQGIRGTTEQGELISVGAHSIQPNKGKYGEIMTAQAQSPDYPSALYVPAYSGNYMVANRPSDYPVKYIVIHTTQGSYTSAISWFQNPSAGVSAHYTVRSSDGQITQSVREKDVAYHAGNWTYNTQAIGIEHEGYIDNPSAWYTDVMYRSSAALTRSLALKYGIPMDRSHIIGHIEVPNQKYPPHTDPGSGWNWTYYMQLVTQGVQPDNGDATIDELESGFSKVGAWKDRACGFGNHTYWTYATNGSDGVTSSNSGVWRPKLPNTGQYKVLVHIPQACGIASPPYATTNARYTINYAGGSTSRTVDHNTADEWVELGTFQFNAGSDGYVRLTDLTSEPYSAKKVVFFDAVQWIYQTPTPIVSAQLVSARMPSAVPADGLVPVQFTIKNTGNVALDTQGPDSSIYGTPTDSTIYNDSDCFAAYGKDSGKLRVTLGFSAGSTTVPINCSTDDGGYPWRWGLKTTLQPGETRTVIGLVRFRARGTYTLRANLISENVKYYGIDGNGGEASLGSVTVKDFPYRVVLPMLRR